jgi:hypothetical protein
MTVMQYTAAVSTWPARTGARRPQPRTVASLPSGAASIPIINSVAAVPALSWMRADLPFVYGRRIFGLYALRS